MPGSPHARARRAAATQIDHTTVILPHCVYCAQSVAPQLRRNGETRHFDHFIPAEIIIRARAAHPRQRFANWLLPCCLQCNVFANAYFFPTFAGKFDYLQWKLGHCTVQCPPQIRALAVPKALAAIVRPMAEYRDGDYPISAPARLENGDWSIAQELAERVLQCSSQIQPSAPSKTAFSLSQAM
jgi:hypothetical protein